VSNGVQKYSWRLFGRTLYDITQLLESADGAEGRVRRVLGLLRGIVPYDQCAMLEAAPGCERRFIMVPEAPADERPVLEDTLLNLLGQLVDPNGDAVTDAPLSMSMSMSLSTSVRATRPQGTHLAVPLVGLDEVIGLVLVRSSKGEYTEDQLRALSVVAAKLAAYVTTRRARAQLLHLARERDYARRAAEAATQAKDDLLALVSLELKKPLASILVWAQVLHATTDDAAAARARALDELKRNAQTQLKLIDDILGLACVASSELRLNLRSVEPAGLIKATIEGLRLEAERRSIQIDSNLDEAAMPLLLDPDRIGQVVSILVANAIQSTPAGGHVGVCLERAAGYARIQVSDGGNGIGHHALPHVFDRFGQARFRQAAGSATDSPDECLGVGLAIVRDVVELHGGRVRAENAGSQHGTTFTMELPRAPGVRA
jgi:signal transduction histidine kinase